MNHYVAVGTFLFYLAFGFCLFLVEKPAYAQGCDIEEALGKARSLLVSGAFEAAYQKAANVFNCNGDTSNIQLLLTQYEALRNLRKHKSAWQIAVIAKKALEENPDTSLLLPVLVSLAEGAALRNNEQLCTQFLAQIRELLSEKKIPTATQTRLAYIDAMAALRFYDKIAEGEAGYRKALALFEQSEKPDIHLKGQILRALGNRARQTGDLKQSVQYYQQELDWYLQHYPLEHADVAICHYNLGGVLYEMLEYPPALDHFLQCFAVWEQQYPPSSQYYRFLTEAIADMYWELGNRPKALAFYDLSVAEEQKLNRDSSELFSRSADTLLNAGDAEAALRFYEAALDFRKRNFGEQHALTASCQNFVARAHLARGEEAAALAAFQESILMLVDSFSGNAALANPMPNAQSLSLPQLLEAMAGKGGVLLQKAKANEQKATAKLAFESLQLAMVYLEKFRQSAMSEASKKLWNQRSLKLLESAIESALLMYEHSKEERYLEAAFQIAEKGKAFLLLSALQEEQAVQFAGVPAELTAREQELRQQILAYDSKVMAETQRCSDVRAKQLELWQEKLQTLRSDYNQLIDQLKLNYPDYFNLKYKIEAVPIVELQSRLKQEGQAMLAFFEGEHTLYSFFLDGQQLRVFDQQKDSSYFQLVSKMAQLVRDKKKFLSTPRLSYREYVETAYSLYQKILAQPIAQCPESVGRLLIIPDGQLAVIPFAALLPQPVSLDERAYRELPYLARRFAISYAPSATVWKQAMSQKAQKMKRFYTGFAPNYDTHSYAGIGLPQPLPFAEQEVIAAQVLFGGKVFLGQKATEAAFRQQSASILHLASHAIMDDAFPLRSGLLLHPADSTEDGIIHAYEVYGMDLPAQLAILSACESGAGQFEKGEGLISLERAFQYAGCPAMLSTGWSVDDAAMATLVGYFLEALKKGVPKDIALQEAQLRFLQTADPDQLLPYYWSGLRLSGSSKSISSERSYWWGVVVIVLGFGFWVLSWKMR